MTKMVLFTVLVFILSCKDNPAPKENPVTNGVKTYGQPNIDVESIKNDHRLWWNYYAQNISLESDFIAIDESSKEITKLAFLEKLTLGHFIPIKLLANRDEYFYKLYKLDEQPNEDIKNTMVSSASLILKNVRLEGSRIPGYHFVDLKGNKYTPENRKGKIMVIKWWFIGCKACVAEFPELNKLVKDFEHKNNIAFISLAFDKKKKLEQFIDKKPFAYKVIPEQKKIYGTITKGNSISYAFHRGWRWNYREGFLSC